MARLAALSLLLLTACSEPPEISADSTWVSGPCGHDQIRVQVQTEPGLSLTLERSGQTALTGVADERGVLEWTMPLKEYGRLTLTGERGGQTTQLGVPGPKAIIRNIATVGKLSGKPMVKNVCALVYEDKPLCKLGIDPDGVSLGLGAPDGTTVTLGENTATMARGQGQPTVPIPVDRLTGWDFSVFSSGVECPHVSVSGVQVEVSGKGFEGDVWVSRVGADFAVGRALGASLDGEPWSAAPTGDVALVVERTSEAGTSSFKRWAGEPGPLTDVRWLVRRTQERVQLGSCGIYTEEGTGTRRAVHNSRRDLHLEIYERATGKLVEKKTVQGRAAGCGSIAFGTSQASSLPDEEAAAWVDGELVRLRGG